MQSSINTSMINNHYHIPKLLIIAISLAATLTFPGCDDHPQSENENVVVVYTSLDAVYSEPILNTFEQKTGIKVLAVYDTEAAKTTGLVNRLIARRNHPDCDVFWNNEVIQTQRLAQLGLLAQYQSPQASRFPKQYRDPNNYWTGFAARLRLIIYNTDKVTPDNAPKTIEQLVSAKWKKQAAIARPFFGTTLSHMIILNQSWPSDRFNQFLNDIIKNDVALCVGNGQVRDLVAAGEKTVGLTDTDDAYAAILEQKPIAILIPDPTFGPVVIPNTVSIIKNCPNINNAQKLIDFLLSPEVETHLAKCPSAQIPLANDLQHIKTPWSNKLNIPAAKWDIPLAAESVEKVIAKLQHAGLDK